MSELTQTKLTLLAWLPSPARTVADIRPSGERDIILVIFLSKPSEHIPAFSGEKSTSTAGEVARKWLESTPVLQLVQAPDTKIFQIDEDWLFWIIVLNSVEAGRSVSENLFQSRVNGLHEHSNAASIFYDTSDCNFHLITKGTAVIQHLSVVNTSRRDTVVSRRGKKTWPNVKSCGCPAESNNVCLSGSGNAADVHHTGAWNSQ